VPTYEYRCEHCDENFDIVQSFHDNPLQSCPTCGSPVRKVFGNVGIVFKGSGFYKTDSREKREKKVGAGAEKGDGASTGASDSGSKPATSAGEKPATSTSNGSGSSAGATPAGTSSSSKEPAPASKASKAKGN
jgi:putative FmdB family regulatory protein